MVAIKDKSAINTTETRDSASEYRNVPLAELVESPTSSRKAFDGGRLDELAASIRTHGVLSPLVVRRVNGHFEIVAGARRKPTPDMQERALDHCFDGYAAGDESNRSLVPVDVITRSASRRAE